ncbi:uncharacterized protein LOC129927195 isoform X3 [Biomphalaria glabrata]|uniref:Uncharacterized protein LOC129927195 isoform X3 n=1 Tax=Biomphalaria glabrata TaxID=6526 RepID=A0A9W3ATP5_BIOGL|nr:uncharacterized protein LOC129927195 isoform X3 [Biomphalaria glabrata]XP_055890590.1 uncharacterized protein LOC129927195 isoform X3 [Biomphalaria glabrata]
MCATSNLVIGVTVFPHKRINKATDHVCIVKKFCQSLQDERVRQGAVVASDHHLLIARVRLKLKKSWTGVSSQCQHYSTIVMKDGENGVTLDNNLKIAVSTVLKVLFIRSPKIEDFNLSFKDYQKIFLQEDSFKKLYAVISKLQQENQNLLEKLNFMNHLEFKDHSCSKPPAVDCISEGEEEEESNLSLTTEKRDIDIQTDMNTANGLDEIKKCAMDISLKSVKIGKAWT